MFRMAEHPRPSLLAASTVAAQTKQVVTTLDATRERTEQVTEQVTTQTTEQVPPLVQLPSVQWAIAEQADTRRWLKNHAF